MSADFFDRAHVSLIGASIVCSLSPAVFKVPEWQIVGTALGALLLCASFYCRGRADGMRSQSTGGA
jgi:hypothetical protein